MARKILLSLMLVAIVAIAGAKRLAKRQRHQPGPRAPSLNPPGATPGSVRSGRGAIGACSVPRRKAPPTCSSVAAPPSSGTRSFRLRRPRRPSRRRDRAKATRPKSIRASRLQGTKADRPRGQGCPGRQRLAASKSFPTSSAAQPGSTTCPAYAPSWSSLGPGHADRRQQSAGDRAGHDYEDRMEGRAERRERTPWWRRSTVARRSPRARSRRRN